MIGDEGITILFQELVPTLSSTLKELYIADNNITYIGIVELAKNLTQTMTPCVLELLDLADNPISVSGCRLISDFFSFDFIPLLKSLIIPSINNYIYRYIIKLSSIKTICNIISFL